MTAIANKDAAYIRELEARLWRSVETAKQAAARIEVLEAALREIVGLIDSDAADPLDDAVSIAVAALAPEKNNDT